MTEKNDEKQTFEKFEHLNIKKSLLRGLFSMNFCEPSSIQKKAILPLLNGKDIIAQGQSGTGKTCCFALACLQMVDETLLEPQALIMTPTRELALQNRDVIMNMGENLGTRADCFIGGNPIEEDVNKLASGSQIIVGTPGKIFELLKRKKLRTVHLKLFILDEADEMLDRGFKQKVKDIFRQLPRDGLQIGLFSATLKEDTLAITNNFMNEPVVILVKNEELTLEGIRQFYCEISKEDLKKKVISELFKEIDIGLCIIQVNTKQRAEVLAEQMGTEKFQVGVIHADLEMTHRTMIMKNFREGVTRILVSTDLLARGIDVQQCNLVINQDLPANHENQIHRIGRGGRFGRKGTAINLILTKDREQLTKIEEHYSTQIEELPENLKEIM